MDREITIAAGRKLLGVKFTIRDRRTAGQPGAERVEVWARMNLGGEKFGSTCYMISAFSGELEDICSDDPVEDALERSPTLTRAWRGILPHAGAIYGAYLAQYPFPPPRPWRPLED